MIKVLIVDDQDILRKGLQMILGFEEDIDVVGTAENGIEAVKNAQLYKPDVILMDIQMPILNGIEAIKKIKEENEEIKIIILTTFTDE